MVDCATNDSGETSGGGKRRSKPRRELVGRVTHLNRFGAGIVESDGGQRVSVPGALPGQKVRVLRVGRKGGTGRGILLELLEPSDLQVPPACRHSHLCGGCTFQDLAYSEQLKFLSGQVEQALSSVGIDVVPLPVFRADKEHGYRNKMEFTFGDARWVEADEPEDVDRSFALGMHLPGRWNRVLDLEQCTIAHPDMVPILHAVRRIAKELGIHPWALVKHHGALRHLVIRKGINTGELMVNLVTSGEQPDKVALLIHALLGEHPQITTLIETIHTGAASVAKGESEVVHHGTGVLREVILGKTFIISPQSFFQTNTEQAENLFKEVLLAADPKPEHRVLDLFCGSGVIGLLLADRRRTP
jgi:23S rRNA (uracil1939-C5)-methyltransferase